MGIPVSLVDVKIHFTHTICVSANLLNYPTTVHTLPKSTWIKIQLVTANQTSRESSISKISFFSQPPAIKTTPVSQRKQIILHLRGAPSIFLSMPFPHLAISQVRQRRSGLFCGCITFTGADGDSEAVRRC